jgi:probable O-glycosylation ligase (exosortase A-associated)
MRDILVSLFILGALPFCFRRPFVGLLMFSLLAYMRLQDLTWGFAKYERWSYYVALLMFAGFLVARERKRWFVPDLRNWIMVLLVAQIGLSLLLSDNLQWASDSQRYVEYIKIVTIALFTGAVVKHFDHLRILLLTIALSLGFYGAKSGAHFLATGGGLYIREGPGGMISDNNDFAMALCMTMPMLLHLGLAEKRIVLRRVLVWMVPLTMMTIVATRSRGAFLSMCCAWMVLIWRSNHRLAGFVLAGLLGAAAFLAVPREYVERLETIGSYEQDASAMGRLRAWRVAGNMIEARPLTGVGFDKFQQNYPFYAFDEQGQQLGGGIKVAHNSYLQIWAECGTPAFLLYLGLIALSFWDIRRVRRMASGRYHASWILNYATMFEASLVAFTVGSMFLNRAHFDLFYHLVAIVMVWSMLSRQAMEDEELYPRRVEGARAPLAAAGGRGFERRPRPGAGEGFEGAPRPSAGAGFERRRGFERPAWKGGGA